MLKGDLAVSSFEALEGALCVREATDTSLFFPEQYTSLEASRVAISSCIERCEARDVCLQYALDNHERFGYWGGYSERDRRKIRTLGLTATEAIEQITPSTLRRGRPPK